MAKPEESPRQFFGSVDRSQYQLVDANGVARLDEVSPAVREELEARGAVRVGISLRAFGAKEESFEVYRTAASDAFVAVSKSDIELFTVFRSGRGTLTSGRLRSRDAVATFLAQHENRRRAEEQRGEVAIAHDEALRFVPLRRELAAALAARASRLDLTATALAALFATPLGYAFWKLAAPPQNEGAVFLGGLLFIFFVPVFVSLTRHFAGALPVTRAEVEMDRAGPYRGAAEVRVAVEEPVPEETRAVPAEEAARVRGRDD